MAELSDARWVDRLIQAGLRVEALWERLASIQGVTQDAEGLERRERNRHYCREQLHASAVVRAAQDVPASRHCPLRDSVAAPKNAGDARPANQALQRRPAFVALPEAEVVSGL